MHKRNISFWEFEQSIVLYVIPYPKAPTSNDIRCIHEMNKIVNNNTKISILCNILTFQRIFLFFIRTQLWFAIFWLLSTYPHIVRSFFLLFGTNASICELVLWWSFISDCFSTKWIFTFFFSFEWSKWSWVILIVASWSLFWIHSAFLHSPFFQQFVINPNWVDRNVMEKSPIDNFDFLFTGN